MEVNPGFLFTETHMPCSTPDITDTLRYDRPTIVLHWTTAFLVLLQFALDETWNWPAKPVHHLMVVAHLTVGILLTVIMAFRIVWRLTKGRHLSDLLRPVDRVCALGAEYTLYGLLLAMECRADDEFFRPSDPIPVCTVPGGNRDVASHAA